MPKGDEVALNASDLTITTVAVTIKAVQVGKKQMTQSIFRQLPFMEIMDEGTLEIRGTPWGRVNYTWGGQEGTAFLIQHEGKLYRSLLRLFTSDSFEETASPLLPSGYRALRDRAWSHVIHETKLCVDRGTSPERGSLVWLNSACKGCWPNEFERRYVYWPFTDAEEDSLALVNMSYGENLSYSDNRDLLYDTCREAVSYLCRWDKLMTQLAALEQLFIAC